MSGKYSAFEKLIKSTNDEQYARQAQQAQPMRRSSPPRGNSVNAFGRSPSPQAMRRPSPPRGNRVNIFDRTPSRHSQHSQHSPQAMRRASPPRGNSVNAFGRSPSPQAMRGQSQPRVSIFDRTASQIKDEEDLVIVIEDENVDNTKIEKWLPIYFVPSWVKYRNSERKKIPFSVLIWSVDKQELRDLDELWYDYNGNFDSRTKTRVYNPREYFAALLNNDSNVIDMVKNKAGVGIDSYRNVLKCLLLINLNRIHKIVDWDDKPNAPGIPIYDASNNKIFKNIKVQNILDGGALNPYEQEFVNIMNEEAFNLYSTSNVHRAHITPNSSPFNDMERYNEHTNNAFFELVNTHFRIFLNRVTIRYWKSFRNYSKKKH